MKNLKTKYLSLHYENNLEDFIQNSLNIFNERLKLLQSLFNEGIDNISKMKCSFFTNKNDFTAYINKITNGKKPPNWTTGCFYNDEIQILVDVNNQNQLNRQQYTLIHEYTHLCIKHLIYETYNIERIKWLDESYARYIDGHLQSTSKERINSLFKSIIRNYKNLNMNDIDNVNNIRVNEVYAMFDFIGKYIFENNLAKEYLDILKSNNCEIVKIGQTILFQSLQYLSKKDFQMEEINVKYQRR